MVDRTPRSQRYQFLLCETVFSHEMLSSFSNEDSISARLNPWNYDEELIELEEQLKKAFWRLVKGLTDRQRDVITLYAEGKTQCEIAHALGVNQSSINKNLLGSKSYGVKPNISEPLNGDTTQVIKSFGGSKKKLNKMIETDEEILGILRRMAEIRSEKW
jgi:DNA-binding CsgD family transcriptional regulator